MVIYAIIGSLWISFAETVIGWLFQNPKIASSRIDLFQGLLFFLLTSSLLYLLFYRRTSQLTASEKSLRESELRFRSIFELAAVGVALIDPRTGEFVKINAKYCDLIGYSADEIVGKRFQDITHPEDRQTDLDNTARLLAGSTKSFSREKRYMHRNGYVVWVNLTVSPLWLEGQEPNCQIVIVNDITARKAEEILLLQSEEQYRKVVEDQNETICRFKADGTYLFVNDAYCRILGKTRVELLGSSWHSLAVADELPIIEEQLRLLSPSNPVILIEKHVRCGSGEVRWMHFINSGFFDIEGRLVEIQSVGRDITERKKSEDERLLLEQQFQQAQKAESLGVLAGGIAHDFNNILTIILGHCHILNNDIDSGLTHKEHVQQIEAAGSRAVGLCRQMLTYAGQSSQVQARVNLWLLVDGVVKMLASAINKNVTMKLDLNQDVPELTGDNVQIQQIVMNLIINAAEAIGDSGGIIKVALKKTIIQAGQSDTDYAGKKIAAREYACLEVSDSGCGIEIEAIKRIFEPFYTTKTTGRGLGMSAVLGIVKSHDGVLQLTSAPGAGTTFKVYFPLADGACAIETRQAAGFVPSARARGTVLLVDDEKSIRTIGSALLNALGFSTITASNGREALDIYSLRTNEVDMILLDLVMPVMGGVDTYRLLREQSRSIPIVICSGYGVEGLSEEIGSDEFSAIAQKPFDPDQLLNTLMKLFEKTEQTIQ